MILKKKKAEKKRVDVLVVEQGLAETRQKAQALILARKILSNDSVLEKPGVKISSDILLRKRGSEDEYVSRAAHKLLGAFDSWKLNVQQKTCLDVGASTGGFTQVLLERGAKQVYAVDVGHNQMHWKIRSNPHVVCKEGMNIREARPDLLSEQVDFICIDTSFISLKLVLPAVLQFLKKEAELIALIKPQHEVKKEEVGKGGIVRDPVLHSRVCKEISLFAQNLGLTVKGLIESPVRGATGNKEFLIYLQAF